MGKPKTGLKSDKLRDFKRWRKRMKNSAQKAFEAEQKSQSVLRPRDRADNVFRVIAYNYLRELKRAGLIEELRDYVQRPNGSRWNRHRSSDELWVIRLIAEGEQDDQMRKKRDRWAAELKLADINDVMPELLLGFLFEAGPTDLIEQDAKAEVRYPWAECYRQATRTKDARKTQVKRKEFAGSSVRRSSTAQADDETSDGNSLNDPDQAHLNEFDEEDFRPDAAFTYGKSYGMP